MLDKEWLDYFRKELEKARKDLADFESAVSAHGLRVRHRDVNGERDVTELHRHTLQQAVAEYQSIVDKETKGA